MPPYCGINGGTDHATIPAGRGCGGLCPYFAPTITNESDEEAKATRREEVKNYPIDIEIPDTPDRIPTQELKDKRLLGKDITPATIGRAGSVMKDLIDKNNRPHAGTSSKSMYKRITFIPGVKKNASGVTAETMRTVVSICDVFYDPETLDQPLKTFLRGHTHGKCHSKLKIKY
jgi:hypothetical protein